MNEVTHQFKICKLLHINNFDLQELSNLPASLASLEYPSLLVDQYVPTKYDICQISKRLKLETEDKLILCTWPPFGPKGPGNPTRPRTPWKAQ